MDRDITTISIPKPLAEKIRTRIQGTGFRTVSSYITYVMRQVLSKVEEKEDAKPREVFTEKDEAEVKARLKSLGYLD